MHPETATTWLGLGGLWVVRGQRTKIHDNRPISNRTQCSKSRKGDPTPHPEGGGGRHTQSKKAGTPPVMVGYPGHSKMLEVGGGGGGAHHHFHCNIIGVIQVCALGWS